MATKKTTTKAEPVTTTTAKTSTVKEAPAKTPVEAPVKEEAKTTEKAAAKKTTTRKTTTAKTTTRKTTTRKTAAKKAAAPNTEVYIQFWGKEVYAKDVVENIKKIWTDEMGKKLEELEDLKVYIKPEENGAYYVINNEITDFIGL